MWNCQPLQSVKYMNTFFLSVSKHLEKERVSGVLAVKLGQPPIDFPRVTFLVSDRAGSTWANPVEFYFRKQSPAATSERHRNMWTWLCVGLWCLWATGTESPVEPIAKHSPVSVTVLEPGRSERVCRLTAQTHSQCLQCTHRRQGRAHLTYPPLPGVPGTPVNYIRAPI